MSEAGTYARAHPSCTDEKCAMARPLLCVSVERAHDLSGVGDGFFKHARTHGRSVTFAVPCPVMAPTSIDRRPLFRIVLHPSCVRGLKDM